MESVRLVGKRGGVRDSSLDKMGWPVVSALSDSVMLCVVITAATGAIEELTNVEHSPQRGGKAAKVFGRRTKWFWMMKP